MTETIKIGGKDMPVTANAATVIWIKTIFGIDFINVLQKSTTMTNEEAGGYAEAVLQLAYVMNKQATVGNGEMKQVSRDGFIDWLTDIGSSVYFDNSTAEILRVFQEQSKTTSSPKKASGR